METPSQLTQDTEPPTLPPSVSALADLSKASGLDCFAVILEGSGLWPRAFPGSLLICSTAREPLPGDLVLAQVSPGGPVRCLQLNGDGDLTANRCFVPFDSGRGYTLVATVTEVIPPKN